MYPYNNDYLNKPNDFYNFPASLNFLPSSIPSKIPADLSLETNEEQADNTVDFSILSQFSNFYPNISYSFSPISYSPSEKINKIVNPFYEPSTKLNDKDKEKFKEEIIFSQKELLFFKTMQPRIQNHEAEVSRLYPDARKTVCRAEASWREVFSLFGALSHYQKNFSSHLWKKYQPTILVSSKTLFSYNSRLKLAAKVNDITKVNRIFLEMKQRNVEKDYYTYHLLAIGFMEVKNNKKIIDVFNEANKNHCHLKLSLYSMYLKALVEEDQNKHLNFGNKDLIEEKIVHVLNLIRLKSFQLDTIIYKPLLFYFVQIKDADRFFKLLAILKTNKVVFDQHIYTAIIYFYIKEGDLVRSLQIFQIMENKEMKLQEDICQDFFDMLVEYSQVQDSLKILEYMQHPARDYDLVKVMDSIQKLYSLLCSDDSRIQQSAVLFDLYNRLKKISLFRKKEQFSQANPNIALIF